MSNIQASHSEDVYAQLSTQTIAHLLDTVCKSQRFLGASKRSRFLMFAFSQKKIGYFRGTTAKKRSDFYVNFYREINETAIADDPEKANTNGRMLFGKVCESLEHFYLSKEGSSEQFRIGFSRLRDTSLEPIIFDSTRIPQEERFAPPGSPQMSQLKGDSKRDIPRELHQYHLTRAHDGRPIWYYSKLSMEVAADNSISSSAVFTRKGTQDTDAHILETYRFKLEEDHGHLRLYGVNLERPEDFSVQVYPKAFEDNLPWCGASVITIAGDGSPAGSVCILSGIPLISAVPGEAISSPGQMKALSDAWRDSARKTRLKRVSQTGEVYGPGDWDNRTIALHLSNFADQASSGRLSSKSSTPPEVRIWMTVFSADWSFEEEFCALARAGVNIRILLMNPENDALIRAKYRLRSTRSVDIVKKAKRLLNDQIAALKDLRDRFSLEENQGRLDFRLCDVMPCAKLFHLGEEYMLIGSILPADSWEKGPLVKLYPASSQWSIFTKNWDATWRSPLNP